MPKPAKPSTAHPLQPLRMDANRRITFVPNLIVQYLLEHCEQLPGDMKVDMNELARLNFPRADREQFAQLIGYDINGFADLSYVSDKTFQAASAAAKELKGE